MSRIFLDSCIVIYLIQAAYPTRQSVRRALFGKGSTVPEIFVSDLVRLECRVWPIREKAQELLVAFDRFF